MLLGRYGLGGSSASGTTAPVAGAISAISANSNSSNATNTIPGSVASGTIVWLHVSVVGSASTVTPPAGQGWSLATSSASSGSNAQANLYWKLWGGGFTDSTTVAVTGTGGNMRTVIGLITGCNTVTPVASASGGGSTVDGTTLTAPSITGGGNLLVGRFFTANGSLQVISDAALSYQGASYSWTSGFDGACAGILATSSSDPTGTYSTVSSVSSEWTALTVAFQP